LREPINSLMAISRQNEASRSDSRKGPDVEDLYRLSPIQQGMLFHSLSSPSAGMYFEQLLSGGDELGDLEILREAWRRTTARHPILRTTFLWEGLEQPVQVVHRSVPDDLRTVELPAGLSREEVRRELERVMDEDRREGFDLTRAPLARWTLVHTGDAGGGDDRVRGWAIWSYHHMLLDGWSALGVMREVGSVYRALAAGEEAELPERRPFRDYLTWLRRRGLGEAEAYWRKTLAGFTAPNRIALGPNERAGRSGRAGREVGEHGRIERVLGKETTVALQQAARERRVTLGTLLQGAWAAVLSRFSGDRDVVFGVTVSGRPTDLPGSESMLGCFINTLPVRIDCSPDGPVGPWLAALQESQVEMRRHEHSPLVSVREWSDAPSDQQLFESILVFENFDAGFAAQEDHAPRVQRTNFPLVVLVEPEGDDLRLRIGTDGNRFRSVDARRLLAALTAVLERLPGALVGDRPLRDLLAPAAGESRRLLEWSAEGAPDEGDETPVHLRIAARTAEAPDRVALAADGGCWSYGALAARARALAHRLTAAGAGPGDVVGVAVERSPELAVALLGVLQSGAAYLPLDPELPTERLALLLDDAATAGVIPVVVADEEQGRRLGDLASRERELTVLAPDGPETGDDPGVDVPHPVDPDHPAYVLYTSGSTGRPKGVVIPHRALARRLDWGVRHDLGSEPAESAFLHKTTAAFDVSVLEVFLPLLAGGRVVMARAGGQKDPGYLAGRIERERVTHASFPPSVYPHLLAHDDFGRSPALRVLYTAGEEVTPELASRAAAALEGTSARFENRYGPTETTIGVLGWVCRQPAGDEGGPVPIGRPIAGARVHVLGPDLLPTPPGVPGELCVAGPLLARGYHRRPARTASSFVPNPFPPATPRSPSHPQGVKGTPPPDPLQPNGGERLYRTGDLVRFRDDGAVLFLGRIDRQVKVRGFRIELEEVERALADLPGVREAAVVVRRDELVAYWAPEGGQRQDAPFAARKPTDEALRRALAERLPPYMVPGAWVELEALPRTSSLKLDTDALPEPGRSAGEAEYEPPRTETERAIAEIWSSVLEVERIGRHDDFFQLGGHSLHLVGVAGELGKRFDPVPALADVARATTVAELAEAVDAAARGDEPAPGSDRRSRFERMVADTELDPTIRPGEGEPVRPDEGLPILLTGATGFLGAHLLSELLRETEAAGTRVRCLVRARDAEHGRERLRRNLEQHQLWHDGQGERIEVVVGDLAAERLGLSEAELERLAHDTGVIVHNGALLDLLRRYADLAAANVGGTRELLRLACTGRPKPFAYVSTLSVFDSDRFRGGAVAWEDADLSDPEGLTGGYAQSKWVAERLVAEAGGRGLPVAVFRPGVVAGDSRTGISATDDYAGSLFRGCLELGLAPNRLTGLARLSPVDFVSRAIVRLTLRVAADGGGSGEAVRNFHPLNPRSTTVERLFEQAGERGFQARRTDYREWVETLLGAVEAASAGNGRKPALAPFVPLFAEAAGNGEPENGSERRSRIRYECRATAEALAELGVEPPPGDSELLERYLDDWVDRGLLAVEAREGAPP
jgi:myxalamid-type nonribosomal peptide synthetase MxaA